MIVSKEEILDSINKIAGEDSSDEVIKLLEDVSDTFDDYASKTGEDWKTKYEENDKAWREKYRARFMNEVVKDEVIDGDNPDNYDEDVDSPEEKKTFEDLFDKE